jgi:hypothetical protein
VSKKGIIHVRPTDVHTRNLRRKAESVLLLETHAFCAKNMGAHIKCTSLECQRYEKRDEKLDFCAAKKGAKKLVSSNFAKILEFGSSD